MSQTVRRDACLAYDLAVGKALLWASLAAAGVGNRAAW
jgi:hypothetical protein